MDLADFMKAGLKELQKKRMTGSHVDNIIQQLGQRRRSSRYQKLMELRKINENTLTPVKTPVKSKETVKHKTALENTGLSLAVCNEKKPNVDKRKALLMRWKEEKQKKLELEKNKRKPIFKVTHCSELPSIEDANQFIKGKKITPKPKGVIPSVYKFAPSNHIFKPPANIKPVNLAGSSKKNKILETNETIEAQLDTCSKIKGKRRLDFESGQKNKVNAKGLIQLPQRTGEMKVLKNEKTKEKILITKSESSLLQKPTNEKRSNRGKKMPSSQILVPKVKSASTKLESKSNKSSKPENSQIELKKKINKNVDPETVKQPNEKKLNSRSKNAKSKVSTTSSPKISTNIALNKEEKSVSVNIRKRRSKNSTSKISISKEKLKSFQSSGDDISAKSVSPEYTIDELAALSMNDSAIKLDEVKLDGDDSVFEQEMPNSNDPLELKTPNKKESPIYISPFVTVSRGKDSARKEFKERLSKGGTFENKDSSKYTSPKAAAAYFKEMLNSEVLKIELMCEEWNNYKTNEILPDGACDMIDVATGQATLLVNQKLKQFQNLIQAASNKENKITCQDLHGFWDLVYIQINNVMNRFANLENLKTNNWEEIICVKRKTPEKRKTTRKASKKGATSRIKKLIEEARQKNKQDTNEQNEPMIKIDLLQKSNDNLVPISARRCSSPGLSILKASQSAKKLQKSLNSTPDSFGKVTPAKSILKSANYRNSRRKHKSVLFEEEFSEVQASASENQENNYNIDNIKANGSNVENLIIFSPKESLEKLPRRSSRLSERLPKYKLFK